MPNTINNQSALINQLISNKRLESYKAVFHCSNEAELIGAYLWNIEVCSALYPLLTSTEVTLRNSIDHASGINRPPTLKLYRSPRSWQIHQTLLRTLPRRAAIHGKHPRKRKGKRLCRNHLRPPLVSTRHQSEKRHHAPSRRTHCHQRPTPMQGSAADIIKRAMIKMHHWLAQTDLDVKMIMQVHDELIFEVAEKDIDTAKEKSSTSCRIVVRLTCLYLWKRVWE
jgi:hypothetical protein